MLNEYHKFLGVLVIYKCYQAFRSNCQPRCMQTKTRITTLGRKKFPPKSKVKTNKSVRYKMNVPLIILSPARSPRTSYHSSDISTWSYSTLIFSTFAQPCYKVSWRIPLARVRYKIMASLSPRLESSTGSQWRWQDDRNHRLCWTIDFNYRISD